MATETTVDSGDLTVRQATRADLLAVYRLETQIFDEPWSYSTFEEFLGEPAFLVAERADIVGYVVADWTANFGGGFGHIKDLAVAPAARHNGIGRCLLQQAISRLLIEGINRIKLEVREGNRVARQLYVDEGFEPVRRMPGYYSDGEAAVVFVSYPPD